MTKKDLDHLKSVMQKALTLAKKNKEGNVATYIPELANMPAELTSMAITLKDGTHLFVGQECEHQITLQSAAKLVVLIGLLEELGAEKLFSIVKVEPSGADFASVARLDQFGPEPSNPMLNSGAILLCNYIPGKTSEQKLYWLETWVERLFGEKLNIDGKVFASEKRTGDRNRSLAYLLKSNGLLKGDVGEVLDTYFYLCSFQATVSQASYLPMLLAHGGVAPNGTRVISTTTAQHVTAIMATCGLYNESGTHLVATGMPAKSSVSGFILAVALGHAGIAVMSPRVTKKGTSIRGEIMLRYLAEHLSWHLVN